MAEEHDEVRPGFDRRSLIKKGLVGAGIAVTAPVISTFNTAAFAQSLDGLFAAQYTIVVNAAGQVTEITRVPKDTVGACITEVPAHNVATEIPDADINEINNGTTVTFTATEDCVFVDAAADTGNGEQQCIDDPPSPFSAMPGDPLTFTPPTAGETYRVRLVIDCGPV